MSHKKGFYEKNIKRPQDFLCAAAATVVLSPVMGVTALLVRKKLGSPVLFTQERPGLNGKVFKLYKFRSMTDARDENGALLPDSVRLTPFGAALRRTSLDELPELFNILKGDMSVVGPRPLLVQYLPCYNAHQARRHEVRPGLTGLAQVHGRNAISWEEKFDWDVKYVDHISFLDDWKIVLETVKTVLKREGISAAGEATMGAFVGSEEQSNECSSHNVLIFANDAGGLYSFRRELLEALKNEYKVSFCTPASEITSKIEALDCHFIPCNALERRSTSPLHDFKLLRFYRALLNNVKPDVVLTYTIKPNVYGGVVCALKKVPYLANVTGLGTSIENGGLLAFITKNLYRIGLKKASCVFFQNASNRELFIGEKLVKGKTRLIPGSGVNLDQHCAEPYPGESDQIRFLFVGRVMKDKGIEELLRAFEIIHREHPETSLSVIGPYEEDYREAMHCAEEYGVRYLGPQSDVHGYYKACHCVVLPSYHEGTSNVMLEASATARPVITTRVPGCRETFDEGITGFGSEAKSAESLAQAMRRFLALSHEEKATMGLAARAKMEREFDRNIVIRAYMDEIQSITKEDKT